MHKWEDNMITDLKERGRRGVNWICVAQDTDQWQVLVNTVMNLWVP
jgi:hypothetical protein